MTYAGDRDAAYLTSDYLQPPLEQSALQGGAESAPSLLTGGPRGCGSHHEGGTTPTSIEKLAPFLDLNNLKPYVSTELADSKNCRRGGARDE
jgi:hypothetical protein